MRKASSEIHLAHETQYNIRRAMEVNEDEPSSTLEESSIEAYVEEKESRSIFISLTFDQVSSFLYSSPPLYLSPLDPRNKLPFLQSSASLLNNLPFAAG
jgi:hypothetical protein